MSERISREELVRLYNIEVKFFDDLAESGLISTVTENQVQYLVYDELPAFERFTNWHYDLDVNLPGLEVINELLKKIELLQQENSRMQHLKFLRENDLWEDAEGV